MRTLSLVWSLLLFSSVAYSFEPVAQDASLDATISRGLAFLAKDAVAWRDEHHCVSCHHAGLVVWAMRESQAQGLAVDEPLLGELTKWIAESGDGKTGVPRPEGIPKALNEKAISLALALTANPKPDELSQAGLKLLMTTVTSDQVESGAWASWPETRPPIFGNSDERATVAAVLSLLSAADAGDESATTARDRAMQWLTSTPSDDDPQSIAMRLVLWRRLGRPLAECDRLADRIVARQKSDGGWSQATEMSSDAWATGQALYALAQLGRATDHDAFIAGQAFLTKTQRDDGSWAMTSRPTKPGGEGSKSLIPITAAGSAWAVMGLARSR